MLAAHHRLTNKFTGTKKNRKSYKILQRTGNFQEIKFGLTLPTPPPPERKKNIEAKQSTHTSKITQRTQN